MITGDHLNIAKETARLIGMGVNIHAGEETRVATQERNDLIWKADGFAQVCLVLFCPVLSMYVDESFCLLAWISPHVEKDHLPAFFIVL